MPYLRPSQRVSRARRAAPTADRLAPVSGELPTRVRATAWYFEVTGALSLLALAVGVVAVPLGIGPLAGARVSVAAVLVNAVAGVAWLWTGRSLAAGERRGGLVAGATLLIPIAARAFGQPVSAATLVLGAVGVLAVLTAWRDLTPGGWDADV